MCTVRNMRCVYWTDVTIWRIRTINFWKLGSMLTHRITWRSSWEIIVDTNRRSFETWKSLYEQRWNIYKMLRNEYKDNFISIGPLTICVCTLNDAILARLDSSSVRITMTEMMLRCTFTYRRNVRAISPTRWCQVYSILIIASANAIR